MSRCDKTTNLEVHHVNRGGSNGLDNARVLCEACHEETPSYGVSGESPPDFSEETKQRALANAGNQCQCTNDNCHLK